jgi:Galactose oxidase, central domain/Kelch motif
MKRSLASLAVLAGGCQATASPSPQPAASSGTPSGAPVASSPVSARPSAAVASPARPSATPHFAGQWETIEADVEPVYTRVALGDGHVLNLGSTQVEDQPAISTAQIWDPTTDTSRDTTPLPNYREQFVVVSLADGRALVTGGLNDHKQSYSSTYLYDPATERWTKSGLLGTARTAAVGAVLRDGRVLVAGGFYTNGKGPGDEMATAILAAYHADLADIDLPDYAAAMATAEIFDPSTGTWSATGPMTYARSGAQAATLADGRVLVFGSGTPGGGIAVDAAASVTGEVFDPSTGQFTLTGPLPPIDRAGLQARGTPGSNPIPEAEPGFALGRPVALGDGGAVIIAFAQSWKHVGDITRSFRYDPTTNAWSEIGQTWISVGEPTAKTLYLEGVPDLSGSAAALLPDGRVLVAGGHGPTIEGKQSDGTRYVDQPVTDVAQYYDPATNTWSPAPSMPEPESGGQALTLADGSVLVYGGSHCSFDTVEYECTDAQSVRFGP